MSKQTPQQQAKINELTWKYFWRRKRNEAGMVVGGGLALTFIPYWVGLLLLRFFPSFFIGIDTICETWACGFFNIIFCSMIIYAVYSVLKIIVESNWKAASRQAKEEVTGKKRESYDD